MVYETGKDIFELRNDFDTMVAEIETAISDYRRGLISRYELAYLIDERNEYMRYVERADAIYSATHHV